MTTPSSNLNDIQALLAAANADSENRQVFSRLCVAVLPHLRRRALQSLSAADADDAVQTTMVWFVDAFPRSSFDSVGKLMAYLLVVLKRRVVDLQRARARRHPLDTNPTVTDDAGHAHVEVDIEALLDLLPSREAEVMRRIYVEGQDVAQAASEMGIEPNSVRKAHRRALAKLKPLLE